MENEKTLTLEGQDEMVLLAERMQKRFPGVIKSKYDNETFLVSTNTTFHYFFVTLCYKLTGSDILSISPTCAAYISLLD